MIAIDIEMPESCWDCELHNYHFCDVTGNNIEENLNNGEREKDCPLKPMDKVNMSDKVMQETRKELELFEDTMVQNINRTRSALENKIDILISNMQEISNKLIR